MLNNFFCFIMRLHLRPGDKIEFMPISSKQMFERLNAAGPDTLKKLLITIGSEVRRHG